MKRLLLILLLLVARPAFAQDEPRLVLDFEQTATIPGQTLELRLTVLVPTYLPKSPVWPSLEAENVLVRVDATRPTSQRVGSATWSGVTRRYLVTPMVPGGFTLPAQQVSVTWADPETNAPRRTGLSIGDIRMSGVIPAGAEGLSPFLAARAVELSQTIEGGTEGLVPGESVTRTVTATIRGTSPMFLPSLLPGHDVAGMRAYASDPVIETFDADGELSGTRVEKVTLIAEGGGSGMAPAVELAWFNLDSGTVEVARLDAIPLSVDAPPATSVASNQDSLDLRKLAFFSGMLIVGLAVALLMVRYGLPPARRLLSNIRQRWLLSELQSWRSLRRVVRRRDYPALRPMIDTWTRRLGVSGVENHPALQKSLTALGEARYSSRAGQAHEDWRSVERSLIQLRHKARASFPEDNLPQLNQAS